MTILLIIVYLAFINLGLPDALLGSSWPVMHLNLHMPLSSAGVLSFIVSGGTIISSLFSSKLIHRFGTGVVTLVSVCCTGVALFGFSISHSFVLLLILCLPLGLGAGSVDAALNNFVALHYKARHMNWLHSFWGIGATTGPILISILMGENHNWRRGYSVISVIQLIMIVILVLSLPLWKKTASKQISNSISNDNENSIILTNQQALQIPGVPYSLASFLCYCAAELTTGLWGASFLVTIKGIDPQTAARWVSLYYGGIALGRFISGFLTVRFSSKSLIRLGQFISCCGAISLLLPLPIICCLISFVLIGLGFAPIFPSMIHETPNRFGKTASQTVIGMQMAFAYMGSTFFPSILGFFSDLFSLKIMPFVVLFFILLMLGSTERINSFMKKNVS